MKTAAQKFGKGFTLVELLVVMVIMGLLMTMAGTVLQEAGKGRTVESGIQEIEGLIREARATAIGNDSPVRIVIISDKSNMSMTSPHLRSLALMMYSKEDRRSGDYDGSLLESGGAWKTISTTNLPAHIYFTPYYSKPLEWAEGEKGSMFGNDQIRMVGYAKKQFVYYIEFDEKGRFVAPLADPQTQTRPQRIVLMEGKRSTSRDAHDGLVPTRVDSKGRPAGAKGIVLWPSGDTSRMRTTDQISK